ncbi:MAG: Rpn family recombination-promoting nuclease/putative transposase [Planctomycetes bacterium]|nr:Rpn family recombination-promoting nuclease/putative transposase [Planctomycetota bacterium]
MTSTPHDSFFTYTFRHPARARQLLRAALPPDLVAAIDWDSLELLPATFVDEGLRTQFADLLFAARCGGERVLIYVLIEHKSGEEPRVVFQILRYVIRIWEQHARDYPREPLPPILPLVVHHGDKPWSSPTSLRDLLGTDGVPPMAMDLLLCLQPDFRIAVLDLAGVAEDDLRRMVDDTLAKLAVLCLQWLHGADGAAILERLLRWCDLFDELRADHDRGQDVGAVCSYVTMVTEMDPFEILDIWKYHRGRPLMEVIHHFGKPIQESYRRGWDEGERRGRIAGREVGLQDGLEQGIEQGIQQGILEGKRTLLHQLLRGRFGELPEDLAQRLTEASTRDLDRWLQGLLTARSAGELLT